MTLESKFQGPLMRALNRAESPVRVWRQQAGQVKVIRGKKPKCFGCGKPIPFSMMHLGAPGVADLTGYTFEGRRVEIEVKGAKTVVSPDQKRHAKRCQQAGVIHRIARYDESISLEANIKCAQSTLDEL